MAKKNKEPVLTYNIGEESHTLFEEDITPHIQPLYAKVSATLKLHKIMDDFFNTIIDEKINALHYMVHNAKGGK